MPAAMASCTRRHPHQGYDGDWPEGLPVTGFSGRTKVAGRKSAGTSSKPSTGTALEGPGTRFLEARLESIRMLVSIRVLVSFQEAVVYVRVYEVGYSRCLHAQMWMRCTAFAHEMYTRDVCKDVDGMCQLSKHVPLVPGHEPYPNPTSVARALGVNYLTGVGTLLHR